MQCPECDKPNPAGARFCLKCGERLALVCPECGAELPLDPDTRFCLACGTALVTPTLQPQETADAIPERIRRLVPAEYAERLLASRNEMAGERRVVTILMSDVKGSSAMVRGMDPEEVLEIMDGAFEALITPIARYEGTVARLEGDAIMAFFGAPIAHEDDPERACRAALDIVRGAQEYGDRLREERGIEGFSVRVGIHTGLVVVGEVGTDLRMEYTAMGDAPNLAARLESAAEPGTVLVSTDTHKLIAPLFETESLKPIEAKGWEEPVPVYRVLAPREVPGKMRGIEGLESELVGREAEYAAVNGCIERLLNGEGGILSIIGEAGVGKSRLMLEVERRKPPVLWLEGRILSFGHTMSYWPFRTILRQCASIAEGDSEVQAWRKLERVVSDLFAERTAEVLPYLATLLAIEVRSEYAERVRYLDSEALGRQVFLASRRFFERLAQAQPVLLLFEDLHWVDESSALVLEHLFPLVESVPLLICCVSRPYRQTTAARLQGIAEDEFPDHHTAVRLTPLSAEVSAQLMRNLLKIEDLSHRVREAIVRKAGGNPFFLEEIIRTLIDAGGIVRDPATDGWQATAQIEAITIPDTVQGVITARLDRLDEDTKQVLRTAAVVGRSFAYRVVHSVSEAKEQLDYRLRELQAIEFIRETRRGPELEYVFRHDLAHEAVYESILLRQRRDLHGRVGRAIEALFADRLEKSYGMLAYHYARAEAWETALEYLLKAGDKASRIAADAEALAHYRQAIETYGHAFGDRWEPIERAALERKMGEALLRRGEHAHALEYLRRALAYLGDPLPTSRWEVRLAIIREVARQIGHRLLPGLFLKPKHGSVIPEVQEEARAYESIGLIELSVNPESFLMYALRGLNLAERRGHPHWVVAGSNGMGMMLDTVRLFRLAAGYHSRAAALAEQIEDPRALSWALICQGLHLGMHMGKMEKPMEQMRQAAKAFQAIGDLHGWGTATYNLAYGLICQGSYGQALTHCHELAQLGREGADLQVQCFGLSTQGQVLQRLGRLDEAIEALKEAIELADAMPDYLMRVTAGGHLGQCYLCQGRLEEALAVLEVTHQVLLEHRTGFNAVPLCNALAEAYLEAAESCDESQQGDWLRKAGPACQGALKQGRANRFGLPEAMGLRGTYDWLRGRSAAAKRWWLRGMALAEEIGQPYELGVIHLQMGRWLRDRAHLESAICILADIGAEWKLAQARRLLAELSGD